jgi:hypothetical protein
MMDISMVFTLICLALTAIVVFLTSRAMIRKLLDAADRRPIRPSAPSAKPIFAPVRTSTRPTTSRGGAAHSLPGTKRHAMEGHIRQVGPELRRRYGAKRHYQPDQVRTVLRDRPANVYTSDYDCYSYATYCTQSDFDDYHRSIGETCDYGAMQQEICQSFDFSGTSDGGFDALNVFELSDALGTIPTSDGSGSEPGNFVNSSNEANNDYPASNSGDSSNYSSSDYSSSSSDSSNYSSSDYSSSSSSDYSSSDSY